MTIIMMNQYPLFSHDSKKHINIDLSDKHGYLIFFKLQYKKHFFKHNDEKYTAKENTSITQLF